MTLCAHFDRGECRSCTLLPQPYPAQLQDRDSQVRGLLEPFGAGTDGCWLPPIASAPAGFRTKAKMVVAGTAADPILTLPGAEEPVGHSPAPSVSAAPAPAGAAAPVDLADCPLYPPIIHDVLASAREVIRRAQIPPYSVARRRGEVKFVLVTAAEDQALVRFVLRSDSALGRLREHLDKLDPRAVVVSANIHPEHVARLEGDEEIPLTEQRAITMPVGDVPLRVLPQSFTQTNTDVAAQLYRQVGDWAADIAASTGAPAAVDGAPASAGGGAGLRAWDLYCGVGGFALHLAQRGAVVTGVEISADAIDSARATAEALGLTDSTGFHVADATAWAREQDPSALPDLAVVNPPRRGLGPDLTAYLESAPIPHVIYSSCSPASLARDLAAMPSLRLVRGRVVDMFPHTPHAEVVVQLTRKEKRA